MRDAKYFRKLQGVGSIDERKKEGIEYVLDCIENYIKTNGHNQLIRIELNTSSYPCKQIIEVLRTEYNFNVMDIREVPGYLSFLVDWSE
jgi:hypothetical protein